MEFDYIYIDCPFLNTVLFSCVFIFFRLFRDPMNGHLNKIMIISIYSFKQWKQRKEN